MTGMRWRAAFAIHAARGHRAYHRPPAGGVADAWVQLLEIMRTRTGDIFNGARPEKLDKIPMAMSRG